MTGTLADDSRTVLLPAGFLALGTFAIGTEGFMIAPLLPVMAKDFALPVPTIALLVIVFTLVLALSSPVTTVVTGRMARKQVLLIAMALFAIGNVVAALSSSFTVLIAARVLMAIAAGLYVPAANGLAGVIVPPTMRGRALAIVSGGQTLAIALGLPLGGLIGHAFGWRATFLLVGAMSLVAIAGIFTGIDRDAGQGIAVASLRERVSVVAQRSVLRLLAVSLFFCCCIPRAWNSVWNISNISFYGCEFCGPCSSFDCFFLCLFIVHIKWRDTAVPPSIFSKNAN